MQKGIILAFVAVLSIIVLSQTTNYAEGQVIETTPSFVTIDLTGTPVPDDFPYGITCDDSNYVWVTIAGQGKIARIDKVTQSVTLFDNDPLSGSGREWYSTVYDSTSDDLFVLERDNGLVLRYDKTGNTWTGIPIVPNFDSPDVVGLTYPSGYTVEPSIIRLQETSGLSTYDLSTGSFGEMKKANGYIWVVLNYSWDFDSDQALLTDQTFNGIVRIDPSDNSITQYSIAGSSALRGVTVDTLDSTILWITDTAANKLYKFSTVSNTVTQTIDLPVGTKARGLADDGLNLYIAMNTASGSGNSKILKVVKADGTTSEIDTGAPIGGLGNSGTFTIFISGNTVIWTDQSGHYGTFDKTNPAGTMTVINTSGNTSSNHFGCVVGSQFWFAGHGSAKVGMISLSSSSNDETRNGSCSGDCLPPSLGVLNNGKRVVDKPVSYVNSFSNFTKPGEFFHTPMENLTSHIGNKNNLTFTVFENSGVDSLWKVGIGADCSVDGSYSDCSVIIEWMRASWGKTDQNNPSTTSIDNDNLIEDYSIDVTPDSCSVGSDDKSCNRVSFIHTWRETPKNPMMIIDLVDQKRNSEQNRLNHGVNVIGESLNPQNKHVVFDSVGFIYTITEISPILAIDEIGSMWKIDSNGFWVKPLELPIQTCDVTAHGYERYCREFSIMKTGQELLAMQKWDSDMIQNNLIPIREQEYVHYERLHDPVPNMDKARLNYELNKSINQ